MDAAINIEAKESEMVAEAASISNGSKLSISGCIQEQLGAKSWSDWPGHSRLGPVPENVRANMLQAEAAAREALQRAIEAKRGK